MGMNTEFGMPNPAWKVDHTAHTIWIRGQPFPCDRDIEAAVLWKEHALLLSSDTDCLSLWDAQGLIRTVRVGVYPQDVTVDGNIAYVCGGADGQIHLLSLPDLYSLGSIPVSGMPERICVRDNHAYVLTLKPDDTVYTELLKLHLTTGDCIVIARYPGLPGSIAADTEGLWVGLSEQLLHLPQDAAEPDAVFEGFGLPRCIQIHENTVLVQDSLEDRIVRLTRTPHPAVEVLHHRDLSLSYLW